jgi:hypothetical protein
VTLKDELALSPDDPVTVTLYVPPPDTVHTGFEMRRRQQETEQEQILAVDLDSKTYTFLNPGASIPLNNLSATAYNPTHITEN